MPPPTAIVPVTAPTLQACKDEPPHLFELVITDMKTVVAHYDPAQATANLSAVMQDQLEAAAKLVDVPTAMYRVTFVRPKMTSTDSPYGKFLCRVPGPFRAYVADLTAPKNPNGRLAFTGDDMGNVYKLKLEDHIKLDFSANAPREKNEKYWFHIITREDCTVTARDLYERTAVHIAKFGMTIQDHDGAFYQMAAQNKEQGTCKWHCEYHLDKDKVPMDANGVWWDISGIRWMVVNDDTNERVKLWIKDVNLDRVFGACNVCYKHKRVCEGHGEQSGLKRPSSQDQAAAAQRRKAGKAKKTFGF